MSSTSGAAEALTLSQLPLFPLQTVLYPGGWLPLRIFEVRYLDMIGRCHKAGAPFGVVCLSEGSEVRRLDPEAPPGATVLRKRCSTPWARWRRSKAWNGHNPA
ncbi:LON peptidase substrate-binding domain-containing protein [Hydrogenophaga sp. ANAO-22]|uniref:LON peptidase substrate-binding domain-containing protein n=1 Tax=Hydrogenophaga sp. ANAO-22 TaxID=3166645 RepID=UPI0036D3DC9F